MSKVINYPSDLKGATPIAGWTSSTGYVVHLEPGDKLTLDDETAMGLITTYPFLKQCGDKPKPGFTKALAKKSSVKAPKKATKKKPKQLPKKETEKKPDSVAWRVEAVKLGVFEVGKTKEYILQKIKEAK